jgi:serine/threonine protein phosphatase 1
MDNLQQATNFFPPQGDRNNRPRPANRRFAVGDVHGCCKTLRALVEGTILLTSTDTLYLLGDYIDRGPDSKGVLDYLMHLRETGYDVRPLMGNHEEMALRAVENPLIRRTWFANGGMQTLRQLRLNASGEIPAFYLTFMAGLPRILTTDDYVFVHAGLDFTTDDPLRDTSPDYMLRARSRRGQPKNIAGRTLVCGHTVTPLDRIQATLHSPLICLDNGCFAKGKSGYGSLVALDLDSRELLLQENID